MSLFHGISLVWECQKGSATTDTVHWNLTIRGVESKMVLSGID